MKSPKVRRVLVYTGRGYSRVVYFLINVTDVSIGWRHASKTKKCERETLRCSMVALDHRRRRFFKNYSYTRMYWY